MKSLYKIFFSFLLSLSVVSVFAQADKTVFNDKDGFFFFIGIDIPNKNVNLVWDEITYKPILKYVVERSSDGQVFIPVITQSADNKPKDVREMSAQEEETLQTLNSIVYTTEAEGHGRFIFNEPISSKLIKSNDVLKQVINYQVKWEEMDVLNSLFGKISQEKPLVYRIKFIYKDGSVQYSGQRSLSDYLLFILKNGMEKVDNANLSDQNKFPIWNDINNSNPSSSKTNPPVTLAACPPVNGPPACVLATGNSTMTNGTCCNYKQEEYKGEQLGGCPCSLSNNGAGWCTPLILDCPPYSSDRCCAGGGCTHYAACGCKPWECCTYTQAPVWYITQSTNLTPPNVTTSAASSPCSSGNSATANISGGSGPFTYSWNPGGYTSSTITNVPAGNYTVTVTDSKGCTDVATVSVTAGNPSPTAIFTSNTVCLGQQTNFNNSSTISSGSITGWSWNFGNGNTSTSQNPTQTYTASGTFSVTLTATSNNGCVGTVTNIVTVNPLPAANFSAPIVCLGTATQFNNSSSGATSWSWNFGDGNTSIQQSPSHTYAAAGNYTVTLTVTGTGGCSDVISIPVTVNPQPVAAFISTTPVCLGNPIQFTDQSTGGGNFWNWNFGDGNTSTLQSPSHMYTAAGNYTATFTVTTTPGGCSSVISQNVTIYPSPVANFSATTVCLGSVTQFTDQSTGGASSWSWNFGDATSSTLQSPSHTYAGAGNYTVTLTVASSGTCSSTFPLVITVNPQPVAAFTATTPVCLGSPTNFTDQSTGGGNSWSWNFGDGNTSTLQSPSHTYTASGTYSITVNVTATPGGCNSTLSQIVVVNPQPLANFSSTTVCVGNPTQFSNLSTGGGNSWNWNFGNGNTSSQQNPSNTYTASGNYTATFTVTATPGGCTSVISQSVTVFGLPAASFAAPPVCVNTPPTNFTDQSTGASTWSWNFGDPSSSSNTSALQSPSHSYSAAGTYSVTLIISSGSGCGDTITQMITVNPKPTPAFTATTACFNNASLFMDQTAGSPTSWSWNFGDPLSGPNNTSSAQNPSHTYSAPGSYTVMLTSTNASGCKDSIVKNIIVNPLPFANFTAPALCVGNITCFNDITTISSGSITGWSWNFADPNSAPNNISNLQNPCHLFSAPGIYNVVLTSTSNNGCQSTTNLPVTVNSLPIAAFSAGSICLNAPTIFANSSSNSAQWYWNFGDGNTSTLQNPSHTYAGYGTYVVMLIASTSAGCSDTIADTLTVFPLPVVDFIGDTVCLGETTSFMDLSYVPVGNASAWSWSFGDPASGIDDTSSLQNPSHIFTSSGNYNVTLTVTSNNGCISSASYVIVVYVLPDANFAIAPGTIIGLSDYATFSDLSTGGAVQWSWWFGDDSTSFTQNPSHIYGDTGTYMITLAIVDNHGCMDTILKPIEILDYTFYIPNAFTPNGDGKNDFFFGSGIGIKEYEMWIFDRWGNRIYYCKVNGLPQTPGCWWNGRVDSGYSDEKVQEDVYIWKVHLTNVFDKVFDYVGTVTVVK